MKDGIQLVVQHWMPAETPRSVVLIVHGYAEHSGRYTHVIDHLLQHGHAVFAYDLRGHGRSEGRRVYVSSFRVYLDDLATIQPIVRETMPDVPLFLFGHSMGGAIVTQFCLERRPDVAGIILSSPALKLPDIAPLIQKFSSQIGALLPHLPTVKLNVSHLSRTPEVVTQAQKDPLYYRGRMPAGTGAALVEATRRIHERMEDLILPFLLIHGTEDRITDPSGSAELYQRSRSIDKTFALYPHLYHETFNEPEKAQVLDAILSWLAEHV